VLLQSAFDGGLRLAASRMRGHPRSRESSTERPCVIPTGQGVLGPVFRARAGAPRRPYSQFEVLGTLDRPLKLCPCFVVPPQLHERHGEVISGLAVLDGMLIGVFIVAEKSQA
jgi:hypothetical protein